MPYSGHTPWSLAAAIHDNGDGTFVPEAVDYLGSSKAIIAGYSRAPHKDYPAPYDDGFQPDTIFCDLVEGKVVHAQLFTEEE